MKFSRKKVQTTKSLKLGSEKKKTIYCPHFVFLLYFLLGGYLNFDKKMSYSLSKKHVTLQIRKRPFFFKYQRRIRKEILVHNSCFSPLL